MNPEPAGQPFDPGLQPERTALAWRRTALALTAGSLLAVRILPAVLGAWALIPAGAGVVLSMSVLIASHLRYKTHHLRLSTAHTDRVPLPDGTLPALVTAITIGGGLAALAVTVPLGLNLGSF